LLDRFQFARLRNHDHVGIRRRRDDRYGFRFRFYLRDLGHVRDSRQFWVRRFGHNGFRQLGRNGNRRRQYFG